MQVRNDVWKNWRNNGVSQNHRAGGSYEAWGRMLGGVPHFRYCTGTGTARGHCWLIGYDWLRGRRLHFVGTYWGWQWPTRASPWSKIYRLSVFHSLSPRWAIRHNSHCRHTPNLLRIGRHRQGQPPCRVSEVETRWLTSKRECSNVVCTCGHLKHWIRSKPNPSGLFIGNTNLVDSLVVPLPHSSVHRNGHHQANHQANPHGLVVGGDAFDSMEDVRFLEFVELSLDEPKLENELITENVDNAWYFILFIVLDIELSCL